MLSYAMIYFKFYCDSTIFFVGYPLTISEACLLPEKHHLATESTFVLENLFSPRRHQFSHIYCQEKLMYPDSGCITLHIDLQFSLHLFSFTGRNHSFFFFLFLLKVDVNGKNICLHPFQFLKKNHLNRCGCSCCNHDYTCISARP